jgi:hypothetical protein
LQLPQVVQSQMSIPQQSALGCVDGSVVCQPTSSSVSMPMVAMPQPGRQATGTQKPKRARRVPPRRTCVAPGCQNRVVQGGRCISHGARRKKCAHPGCVKNVKTEGFCSAHGPARKRCEMIGCPKVAVRGGRCIAHGAKKRMCCVEGCTKQGIVRGKCKKHHDEASQVDGAQSVRANL